MKRFMVAVTTIAAVAAATAAVSSGGASRPYDQARAWETPLGEVYGPVHAGPETSTSYGFVAK